MQERIANDLIAAMKSGDRQSADALKMLKSALQNGRIAVGRDLTEEEVLRIVRKEIKSRSDARDMYAANGRQDLADKEESERVLYEQYVPVQLDIDTIDAIIAQCSQDLGDQAVFAKLMPAVMGVIAGRADGRVVAERVKHFCEARS